MRSNKHKSQNDSIAVCATFESVSSISSERWNNSPARTSNVSRCCVAPSRAYCSALATASPARRPNSSAASASATSNGSASAVRTNVSAPNTRSCVSTGTTIFDRYFMRRMNASCSADDACSRRVSSSNTGTKNVVPVWDTCRAGCVRRVSAWSSGVTRSASTPSISGSRCAPRQRYSRLVRSSIKSNKHRSANDSTAMRATFERVSRRSSDR